ncbi:MAG: alkaline phosphatase family protein [Candidatus Micrarchaeia archaeon]
MKILLVVLDGAADRKIKILGNRTPLQAAKMPNLNGFAKRSFEGMMYPIGKGIAPESDAAVFSILGYDVKESYTGRGPVEALGAGLKIDDNTLALRCNFATVGNDRTILDRRAGRSITRNEAAQLEKEINSIKLGEKGVRFNFKATVGHRAVIAFYSKSFKFSPMVSNADVGYVREGSISIASAASSAGSKIPKVVALDNTKSSRRTADMLNNFIDAVISKLGKSRVNEQRSKRGLPVANAILMRDAGVGLPKVVPIWKKYGMSFAFATEMPVERGIARVLGMKEIRSRWRRDKKMRYREIARTIMKHSGSFDFAYVHLKGPDEPGHDGDAIGKKRALEEIDSGFFAVLPRELPFALCVAEDHSTPCELKAHSADPVPVMIRPSKPIGSDSMHFDENIDGKGKLGTFEGRKLIEEITRHLG